MVFFHLMLRGWALVMRGLRRLLEAFGLLGALERWAQKSRIALWFRSQFSLYDVNDFMKLDLPWWTLNAVTLVDEYLAARPHARVFEWGSGASTMWLEKRAAEVISVENDGEWHTMMSGLVGPQTDLQHVPAVPSDNPGVASRWWGQRGLDFSDYVNAIDQFPGVFDLIVIDGRARTACLDKALERLTHDGMVVFDNTNRPRYREALRHTQGRLEEFMTYGLTPSLPYSTTTSLLKKTAA